MWQSAKRRPAVPFAQWRDRGYFGVYQWSKNEVKTMAQAFFGGVHPHDMKAATNEKAIEQLAPPATVVIPMSMHPHC